MNYTEQQLTAAVVSDGLRPALASLKSGVSARILSLIERCWDGNPKNRPSFDDIVLELNVVLQQINGVEEGEISPIALENVDTTIARSYQENISWLSVGEASSKEAASVASGTNTRILFDSSIHASAYSPIVSCGSFATCGRRETMEDRHFLMPHAWNEKDVHIFGIFDGHRGIYIYLTLPRLIIRSFSYDMRNCISNILIYFDHNIIFTVDSVSLLDFSQNKMN